MSNTETGGGRHQSVRVLAVDDDPNVLDSYQVLFKGAQYHSDLDELNGLVGGDGYEEGARLPIHFELDSVTKGELAVEQVKQHRYAIILLDMRMPGGWDGMETAKRIRENDDQVRIILITAYMDHTLETLRKEIGFNFAYLQKPFDRNELVQLALLLANDWGREQRLIEAERVMAESAREAEQANKAKDDFLATMSHELRTPLTALLGNCELMGEGSLNNSQQELLTSMEVSGKSLLYLINDILDTSKIESGRFKIDEVEFDPRLLLSELQQIFASRASEVGILFRIDQPTPFEKMLVGDSRRLSQILINLLANAVKFTEEGEVVLTIHMDRERRKIHWIVSDTGIGMSDETMQKLFRPFEQADPTISRRFGGTGLGLHISWNLARLMGGTIEVSSEEGRGSRFELVIPLREGAEITTPQVEVCKQTTKHLLKGKVLIAEDTPELQILVRRMVESYGITVAIASNGQQALDLTQSNHYDLILMDMQMPVMDGIQATRKLRELGDQTPVVALTANVMQKQREQFYQGGCDDFISKPIDRRELQAVLEKYLNSEEEEVRIDSVSPYPMVDDELTALFRERSLVLRREMMDAYNAGDWEQVEQTAHTIKGSGSSFGFPELTDLGRQVQEAVKANQVQRAAVAVVALNQALESIE